jgi:hypothetical protein
MMPHPPLAQNFQLEIYLKYIHISKVFTSLGVSMLNIPELNNNQIKDI